LQENSHSHDAAIVGRVACKISHAGNALSWREADVLFLFKPTDPLETAD